MGRFGIYFYLHVDYHISALEYPTLHMPDCNIVLQYKGTTTMAVYVCLASALIVELYILPRLLQST
jgi:hypothetical protein